MKVISQRILVSDCLSGIYLRWWYNGWHYFNFANGYVINMDTESMGIQTMNFFSRISKVERDTRINSEYSYAVTLEGIHPIDISAFLGFLIAERVEQYEVGAWREVDIVRGEHPIKPAGEDAYTLDFVVTRKELVNVSSVYQKSLRLYLGDTLCDMDDEEIVPINKQVNDIAEMQDRQSDFTATFKIRKTRAMKALFELSGEVGASTLFPYEIQPCRLIQDNIEVITQGMMILDKVDEQYYYVQIISGNVNFFKLIDGLKLSDLTLASTNHTWNNATMIATHGGSPDADVVYPLCEPSDDGSICPLTDDGDKVEQYGGWIWPFVKVKAIWDEIFLNAGFTVTGGDLLTSETFLKLFMPIASRSITNTEKYLYGIWWGGSRNALLNDHLGNGYFPGTILLKGDTNFLNGYYYAPYAATYKVQVGVMVSGFPPILELYKNGGYQFDLEAVGHGFLSTNYEFEIALVPGDHIEILTHPALYFMFNVQVTEIKDAYIAYGSYVEPRLYLPDMSQTEFIKLICNMLALVPDVTPRDRKIRFWNYSELYENIHLARDWSRYLSERDDEVEFKFGDYAQNNYLKFKDSTDVLKDNGRGDMEIDDLTLPDEKTALTLPVAYSDEVTILTNNFSVDVSRIAFNKWNPSTLAYDAEKKIDPRIVFIDYVRTLASPPYTKSFFIRDTVAPLTGTWDPTEEIVTPKRASSIEVAFSNLIINYSSLSRLLTKTNLRRAKFNLPVYEVAGLKHNIPVYLSQYKAYFYVNKVNNYVPGKLCTIDLIKL